MVHKISFAKQLHVHESNSKISRSSDKDSISTVHCRPEALCIALFSRSSTLSVAGVSVLFNIALATVDVGMLMNVGKAQVTGFRRNLAATSPGRRSSLSASRKLQFTANRQH